MLSLILSGIFTAAFYSSRLQESFDGTLYLNIIRLHVVAAGHDESDTALKNALKSRVCDYVAALTRYCKSRDEAEKTVSQHLEDIRTFSENQVKKLGGTVEVKASFDTEAYTVRTYGGMTFPAGEYKSLRITLGDAKGKNWWCVLYPNLLDTRDTDEAKVRLRRGGVSQEAADTVCDGKDYTVCFYFLELVKSLSPTNE